MVEFGSDFADGKDAGALRTIGEVCAATGVKPHVLRYWEDQFPQLRPLKRAGGRRLYRAEDVALIRRIAAMVNRDGYTLRGARAALAAGSQAPAPVAQAVDALPTPAPADLLTSLRAIRTELAAALAA